MRRFVKLAKVVGSLGGVAALAIALVLLTRNEDNGRTTVMPQHTTTSVGEKNLQHLGALPGHRNISVTVDTITTTERPLPGDRVDILANEDVEGRATVVLDDVMVLSISSNKKIGSTMAVVTVMVSLGATSC